jgi:acyl dehydratase
MGAPQDGPPVGKRDGEHRPRQNCDELQKAAMTKRYLEDFATGQTFGSGRLRVDRERIRTFAAEFDPQPFRLDEDAARAPVFPRGRERLVHGCADDEE